MTKLALLLSLAAGTASAAPCAPWANPGRDVNTQAPHLSVRHYTDVPPNVLWQLSALVEGLAFLEVVEVRGGKIFGLSTGGEYTGLRDMHYGPGLMCEGPVALPPATEKQRGFVYCVSGYCVVNWFVCHNVSRLDPPYVARRPEVLAEPPSILPPEAPLELPAVDLPTLPDGPIELVLSIESEGVEPSRLPPILQIFPALSVTWVQPHSPTQPIDEAPSWTILLIGLICLLKLKKRR